MKAKTNFNCFSIFNYLASIFIMISLLPLWARSIATSILLFFRGGREIRYYVCRLMRLFVVFLWSLDYQLNSRDQGERTKVQNLLLLILSLLILNALLRS